MTAPVKIEEMVKAYPAEVFFAFTHAVGLTEWLCDLATVAPRPGGRMYLWWHGDFYSAGEYISLEENKSIVFQWHGRKAPVPNQVKVSLEEKDGGTLVTLVHELPEGDYWEEKVEEFRQEWENSLDNLAQVLETGLDKRIFDRPMLGISISDFNADIARAMKVPVKEGIRLDTLPEEMGAYKAGMRKDDVLVELDKHPITNDFGSIVTALQGKKGGDCVEVVYYRGPQKIASVMELSKRPIPQVPWDKTALAKEARAKYDQSLAALEAAFEGVTEEEAGKEPMPGEWSAKETLSHLIQNERHWVENLDDVIGGYPRISDDWSGNSTLHTRATAKAYGTIQAMLNEMRYLAAEMVAYLEELPDCFIARKASYFQTVNFLLVGSIPHIDSHLDQIRNAVEAAREN